MSDKSENMLLPVKEGLVAGAGREDVQLLGSKCENCNEVSIGTNAVCLNCGSQQIRHIELSSEGELWTYTIVRHRPPGGYLGPDPFQPFSLGLVELPDGIRIMAPLDGEPEDFKIGDKLALRPWVLKDSDGNEYRAFRFAHSQ